MWENALTVSLCFFKRAKPFLTTFHNFVLALYIPSLALPKCIDFHSPFCFKSIDVFFFHPFLHKITCTGSGQRFTYCSILLLTGGLGRSINAGWEHNDTSLEYSLSHWGFMMKIPGQEVTNSYAFVFNIFFCMNFSVNFLISDRYLALITPCGKENHRQNRILKVCPPLPGIVLSMSLVHPSHLRRKDASYLSCQYLRMWTNTQNQQTLQSMPIT